MEQSDLEYRELVSSINQLSYSLSRHDHIRMKLWLEKLNTPLCNNVWKNNRNLYLKILREMIQEGTLQKPFHQTPPEGPLPKITLYDVPYPVRMKLTSEEPRMERKSSSCNKNRSVSRKNSCSENRSNLNRSLSKNSKTMKYKKKITFDTNYESMD